VALAALGPDGRLLLGPDGAGLGLGPDRSKLVTAGGRPVVSDRGTQLGLAPNGECEECAGGGGRVLSVEGGGGEGGGRVLSGGGGG
jgi:hypothetical protein